VRDPSVTKSLDETLLAAFQANDEALNLSVPDLINYEDNVHAAFSGAGASLIYDDVFMGRYYEYLQGRGVDLAKLNVEDLRRHHLVLTDENGTQRDSHTIYKSLVFDTTLDGASFHLCEGNWYRVEDDYISRLEHHLDALCAIMTLPPYVHSGEGAYNQSAAAADDSLVCLDTTNISPKGQTEVEPCDLYSVSEGYAVFQHIKISTLSSRLSHLFNQGINAIELIRLEEDALSNLKKRIGERVAPSVYETMVAPLDAERHRVDFVIITHKAGANKSRNLPLFSRISLSRNLKALQVRGVKGHYGFVEDKSPKTAGVKKPRKTT
jgi:uncharacterized protein (TIGR04141 family)